MPLHLLGVLRRLQTALPDRYVRARGLAIFKKHLFLDFCLFRSHMFRVFPRRRVGSRSSSGPPDGFAPASRLMCSKLRA